MPKQDTRPGRAARVLRMVAKVWSILSLVLMLAAFVGEALFPHAPASFSARDIVLFLFFPVGMGIGLILAWFRELIGGGIAIGSVVGFYLAVLIMDGRFPGGPFFVLLAAPGLFFMLARLLDREQERAT